MAKSFYYYAIDYLVVAGGGGWWWSSGFNGNGGGGGAGGYRALLVTVAKSHYQAVTLTLEEGDYAVTVGAGGSTGGSGQGNTRWF